MQRAVLARVSLQIAGAGETLQTDAALERSLSRMNQSVLVEVGQLRESLGAPFARKRSLARVDAKVDLQIRQLREHLLALAAVVDRLSGSLEERIRKTTMSANVLLVIQRLRALGERRVASDFYDSLNSNRFFDVRRTSSYVRRKRSCILVFSRFHKRRRRVGALKRFDLMTMRLT